MKTFVVTVQKWATVEVEAEDVYEALQKVESMEAEGFIEMELNIECDEEETRDGQP